MISVDVAAQTCAGRPGADAGAAQVGGQFESATGGSTFGVGAGGIGRQMFGAATLSSTSYDDFDGSTLSIGGFVGYQLSLGTPGKAQLCPTASASLGFGPNDIEGLGVDASTRSASFGAAFGFRASQSPQFTLIPTADFSLVYSSIKLTDGVDSIEDSDSFGLLSLGVGLILGRQFSAHPYVAIPFGLEGADPSFGVTFALAVGTPR